MGVPITTGNDVVVLENAAYAVGFSRTTRTPLWAAYRLFEVDESVEQPRPNVKFDSDDRIGIPDLVHDSYTNAGYDRGHMVPSSPIGRCYGEDPQLETFMVSNICPQHPGCNQRAWERFEHRESHDYAAWFDVIWVVAGPIFDADVPCEELLSDVRIPNGFYKIVVAEIEGEWEALAIVMPNARTNDSRIRDYVKSVNEIEARVDIDFFRELPDDVEERLESDSSPHPEWAIGYELRPVFPGAARTISKRPCD
ncbi:MAG: DNA/RNA non-specific endonuclease [Planctomycetota bacterium]